MRTNIDIDEALISKVMALRGYTTKKKAVEESLKTMLLLEEQRDIRSLRGKFSWEENLDAMRRDWETLINENEGTNHHPGGHMDD